ncbi:MAG: MotA/TolQ/ExbB proton channel family protein [Kiritimatiellae bacterium]|nr:MotA/TolQ/ExbB proton channel family protein [Kiritimatiellia bacterium]
MLYQWLEMGVMPEPILAGIGFAIRQSNLAGKIIVAILFAGSIFAWSVMLTKMREMRVARVVSFRFLQAYRKETHPAGLFLKRSRFEGSPLYVVYDRACLALGTALEVRGAEPEELFMGSVGSERRCLNEVRLGGIRNVAERTMADQALLLENSMGLLATSASTAPFLGLLGTVWGVMDAFGGMAVTGNAMLSAVAPGISGALLTTVIGLLVALPSAIGYNLLSDRLRHMSVELDNFTQELISDIEHHYHKLS